MAHYRRRMGIGAWGAIALAMVVSFFAWSGDHAEQTRRTFRLPAIEGASLWYSRIRDFTSYPEGGGNSPPEGFVPEEYDPSILVSSILKPGVLDSDWPNKARRISKWVSYDHLMLDAFVYSSEKDGIVIHICDTRPVLSISFFWKDDAKLPVLPSTVLDVVFRDYLRGINPRRIAVPLQGLPRDWPTYVTSLGEPDSGAEPAVHERDVEQSGKSPSADVMMFSSRNCLIIECVKAYVPKCDLDARLALFNPRPPAKDSKYVSELATAALSHSLRAMQGIFERGGGDGSLDASERTGVKVRAINAGQLMLSGHDMDSAIPCEDVVAFAALVATERDVSIAQRIDFVRTAIAYLDRLKSAEARSSIDKITSSITDERMKSHILRHNVSIRSATLPSVGKS